MREREESCPCVHAVVRMQGGLRMPWYACEWCSACRCTRVRCCSGIWDRCESQSGIDADPRTLLLPPTHSSVFQVPPWVSSLAPPSLATSSMVLPMSSRRLPRYDLELGSICPSLTPPWQLQVVLPTCREPMSSRTPAGPVRMSSVSHSRASRLRRGRCTCCFGV